MQIKGFSSSCGADTLNQILWDNGYQRALHLAYFVLNDTESVGSYDKGKLLDKDGKNILPLFVDTLQSAAHH